MHPRNLAIATLAGALALMGCAGTKGGERNQSGASVHVVRGTLRYSEKIALPPDARLVLECREGTTADGPMVVAQDSSLGGRQVPIPFEIRIPRKRLVYGRFYGVRAAFFVGGLPRWVTYAEAVSTALDTTDLGPWTMRPAGNGDFRSVLTCGDEKIGMRYKPDALLLVVGSETMVLHPVATDSGVRYVGVDDSTTSLRYEGDRTIVTIGGRRLTECRP